MATDKTIPSWEAIQATPLGLLDDSYLFESPFRAPPKRQPRKRESKALAQKAHEAAARGASRGGFS